jgi:hypothetical protein
MSSVDSVFVREEVSFGEGSSFFVVELKLRGRGSTVGEMLSNSQGRRVAVVIDGEVVGFETTSPEWVHAVPISHFLSEDRAVEFAMRIGTPMVKRLSESEKQSEREKFLEYAEEVFWENECGNLNRPDLIKQANVWKRIKETYPELSERIDCSSPPDWMCAPDASFVQGPQPGTGCITTPTSSRRDP